MLTTFFRWQVDANNRLEFKSAWADLTEALKAQGSLGSALFQGSDGSFCALARWPDKKTRDAAFDALAGHPSAHVMKTLFAESVDRLDLDLLDDRWV